MKRVLSPWCKSVKCAMIMQDLSIEELAKRIGMTREYTSAVVNGRIYSQPAVKAISDALNIKDAACSLCK